MSEFRHLNASDLHDMMAQGNPKIVDIRDNASYQQGRITGAQHLDNFSLQQFIEAADLDAPVVVCCYHGNSSQQAAAFLNSKGFEETYSLDGGFSVWRTAFPDLVEAG